MNPNFPGPSLQPATLAAALRQAAAELQAQQPPPELLARLKANLPARRAAPAPAAAGAAGGARAWLKWWARQAGPRCAPALAFATVLAGAAWLLVLRPPAPLQVLDDGGHQAGTPGGPPGNFLAVAPAERWPRSDTPAWLVSTELQRERLAALGLPYDPGRAGEAVRAELLLHPSGEVLAVRLLN